MSIAALISPASPWIVNRDYDLTFIFGGAAASLLFAFAAIMKPSLLPLLFWVWMCIDGSHFWATYSRTYMDREYRQKHRKLLLWSLLAFAAPLAALSLYWQTDSPQVLGAFLMFGQIWAYYHLVRQHYGFLSIYDRKNGTAAKTHAAHKWILYLGLWAPGIFFDLNHPAARQALGIDHAGNAVAMQLAYWLPVLVSAGCFAALFFLHFVRAKDKKGTLPLPFYFSLLCLITYSIIFYWMGSFEPVFSDARNLLQSFMVITMAITLFHDIQYHSIVWHYNRGRYRSPEKDRYGAAVALNKNLPVYLACGVVFSLAYLWSVMAQNTYPSILGELRDEKIIAVAFIIWWGTAFHHYYLDQKIWRFSREGA